MTILTIYSTRSLCNTVLALKCIYKKIKCSLGKYNNICFSSIGLNVCVHPWFHSAGEIWARRNGFAWRIHSAGNLYYFTLIVFQVVLRLCGTRGLGCSWGSSPPRAGPPLVGAGALDPAPGLRQCVLHALLATDSREPLLLRRDIYFILYNVENKNLSCRQLP